VVIFGWEEAVSTGAWISRSQCHAHKEIADAAIIQINHSFAKNFIGS
jgi:hypothetical protein